MKNPRFYQAQALHPPEMTLKKFVELGMLSPEDERLIIDYVKYRRGVNARGLSEGRRASIIKVLCYWRRYIKAPYETMTAEDIRNGVGEFRTATAHPIKGGERPFKQNTQMHYIVILKGFVYFLIDERGLKVDRQKVKKIRTPSIDKDTTRAEQLFSNKDIRALVEHAGNAMHAALIAVASETAARPWECTSLIWGDVVDDPDGKVVSITDYKTGGTRPALLTYAAGFLEAWKRISPATGPQDFIFVYKRDGKVYPLTWSGARNILQRAAERAGLSGKQLKLYAYRKSKITSLYRGGRTPIAAIKALAWGRQDTVMEGVYVKLSQADVLNGLKAGAGIPVQQDYEDLPFAPVIGDREKMKASLKEEIMREVYALLTREDDGKVLKGKMFNR